VSVEDFILNWQFCVYIGYCDCTRSSVQNTYPSALVSDVIESNQQVRVTYFSRDHAVHQRRFRNSMVSGSNSGPLYRR
jgi:hypothetical protein